MRQAPSPMLIRLLVVLVTVTVTGVAPCPADDASKDAKLIGAGLRAAMKLARSTPEKRAKAFAGVASELMKWVRHEYPALPEDVEIQLADVFAPIVIESLLSSSTDSNEMLEAQRALDAICNGPERTRAHMAPHVTRLAELMKSPNVSSVRRTALAIDSLGAVASGAATAIIGAIKIHPGAAGLLTITLGRVGGPIALIHLRAQTRAMESSRRSLAMAGWAGVEEVELLDFALVARCFGDSDVWVRDGAAIAVERMASKLRPAAAVNSEIAADIDPFMRASEPGVRAAASVALRALGITGHGRVKSLAFMSTADSVGHVRLRAIEAFAVLGPREAAVDLLRRALDDKDFEVRKGATSTLEGFGRDASRALDGLRARAIVEDSIGNGPLAAKMRNAAAAIEGAAAGGR